jgi:hypothetical protein
MKAVYLACPAYTVLKAMDDFIVNNEMYVESIHHME